jgi:monovalent cation:H+ antiporter-2, CPA2 family
MMNTVTFLQDLAVVMIVAGVVTVLFHRLRQPVVLGYIVAGAIIGPHTLPFPLIKEEQTIATLADLGVVFLMFSLGLDFSLPRLKKVGKGAFIAATLEILLMIWVGYETGRWFGCKPMDCIFLGAMLSISSTTIIVKALAELGRSKEGFAELIFGILIVEDLLAIVLIALLSGIAMTGRLEASQVLVTVARLAIFLVVALVVGLLAVPRLIGYVARFKSNEMLLVAVLGLCFGASLLAVKLHYSVALGAFVIGAVVAEAREVGRIELLIEPIRDLFSAVFFVAIGLWIDPKLLVQHALPITVITLAVVVGKVLACAFGSFVAGHDTRTSLRVGMGLAQIGEFSFIIAALGLSLGVTSGFLYPIAVTVSAITTLVTPYLVRHSDQAVNWFDRMAPPRLVNLLALYTGWVSQWGEARHRSMSRRLIRKWAWQMVVNLMLVAGLFIAAGFLGQQPPLANLPVEAEGWKLALWLVAMVASLPLLVATYRKLRAVGMFVGEMVGQRQASDARRKAIQAIVGNTIPFGGIVGVAVMLLLLSSTLLTSAKELILLALVLAGVAFLLRRAFIRVYARAQVALEDTLSRSLPQGRQEAAPVLGGLLKEARIERVTLAPGNRAAGKLIRELALRTKTGVSIVAIERNGASIVNPSADEEIIANDQVLLLGTPEQLEAGRRYLAGCGPEP